MKTWALRIGFVLALLLAGFSLFNASWIAGEQPGRLMLVAHDGVRQLPSSATSGRTADPQARISSEPRHNFIANTIPAIRFAYARGADYVTVTVRATADDRLVLFDDQFVTQRTGASGIVEEMTLDELRALDLGAGLTPNGETFPFRDQARGQIVTVEQLLREAWDKSFVFRFVTGGLQEAVMLRNEYALAEREFNEGSIIIAPTSMIDNLDAHFDESATLDPYAARDCFDAYMRSGWYGHVPEICHGEFISVPLDRQWMLWGWPNRFLARMRAADVRTILVATHEGGVLQPLTTTEQLSDVPASYKGLLWLGDIYSMGPALRG